MTNFERWQHYMKECAAPQIFIDTAFYYMISVALQRRVWLGDPDPNERAIFPNIYVLLVARPGVGKGLVIKPVTKLLQSLLKDPPKLTATTLTPENDKDGVDGTDVMEIMRLLKEGAGPTSAVDHRHRLLFPVAAGSTTYQALVRDHAQSATGIIVTDSAGKRRPYAYSSIYFTVEELGTLFREDQTDLMNYLLMAYDCSDFHYKTKGKGEDFVRNPSLNLFAGTTFDFIREATLNRLIDQGFTSRALCISAPHPRWTTFMRPELKSTQITAFKELATHLRALHKIYGQAKLSPEAEAYCTAYFAAEYPVLHATAHPTVQDFLSRLNIHIMKLAMIMHYSETVETNVIELSTIERVMRYIKEVLPLMQSAYAERGTGYRGVMLQLLERQIVQSHNGATYAELLAVSLGHVKSEREFNDVLQLLIRAKRVELLEGRYKMKKVI